MKIKKDNILIAIQKETPLSYDMVKNLYKITNSYDDIIKLKNIALEFNVDVIELAQFLFR